jgi:hypothetical protein
MVLLWTVASSNLALSVIKHARETCRVVELCSECVRPHLLLLNLIDIYLLS